MQKHSSSKNFKNTITKTSSPDSSIAVQKTTDFIGFENLICLVYAINKDINTLNITGTHLAYLITCKRKLWLFARHIRMEHSSDLVGEGKVIGETTYTRRSEKFVELQVNGSKIDFYDSKNKVIHEVKKSNKVEQSHIAQVLFYLYLLEQKGIDDATARIDYPKLRESRSVEMTDENRRNVLRWVDETEEVIRREVCPPVINESICKPCSYFEFCFSGEVDED